MLLLASAASPLPCPDNNSKCLHSIAMKLYNSVNRHKRKFDWRHYRIFYARVMPPFRQMLPLGDTSGVLVFITYYFIFSNSILYNKYFNNSSMHKSIINHECYETKHLLLFICFCFFNMNNNFQYSILGLERPSNVVFVMGLDHCFKICNPKDALMIYFFSENVCLCAYRSMCG